MTENKRYSFNWERGHPNFWDNYCDLADCYLTCEDVVDLLNELATKCSKLEEENEQLKQQVAFLEEFIKTGVQYEYYQKIYDENEQLKQRNNRQYEQLDRLYNLIEQKDWRALNDILDDFKKCDEQLQKEWRTYGDMND